MPTAQPPIDILFKSADRGMNEVLSPAAKSDELSYCSLPAHTEQALFGGTTASGEQTRASPRMGTGSSDEAGKSLPRAQTNTDFLGATTSGEKKAASSAAATQQQFCTPRFEAQNWGVVSYEEAWNRQKELVEARIADKIPDTLVFVEHPAVITLGRGSLRSPDTVVDPRKIQVLETERGGLATYHGPGQVVAYPIFKLGRNSNDKTPPSRRGVHNLIRALESWVIEYLEEFGLTAGQVEGKTGVWIDGKRKIASIGIAARHWVSYHGLALNLSTGKEPWMLLNPCGLGAEVMTDLKCEISRKVQFEEAVSRLIILAQKHF